MSTIVECRNLTKCYNSRIPAVTGINLTIESGRIIGLLGPNGSGKTTIIKMMNGLLQPTKGEVLIDGEEPGIHTRSVVSYLPERTYLEAQKTVADIIDFFDDFYVDFRPDRALQMIDSLGIDYNARLKTLSKGAKEKVQLILVMSRDAKLYILDEPIAGVDPAARDYIIRTIINNYNRDASVLISTHLITDIEDVLDEVIFLKQGHLVLRATVDEIKEKYGVSVDKHFREVFAC
ncbi:MAG: ABC transporter ATP-binding protein [Lachnospiraceae bacterium]|nr:ABC transporter ATP-binding protein [Lachnospiraceae bacterium]MBR6486767.1 ABC transporter ATP-binding protein [Lachnospiraceae bacterium]